MKKTILTILLVSLVGISAMANIIYSRELEEKAILGDANAMLDLSMCYRAGYGIKKDLTVANYWLERSAEEGNTNAITIITVLGDAYKGVPDAKRHVLEDNEKKERARLEKELEVKNPQEALLKKALDGDANAQCKLGHNYYNGNGVPEDYSKAVEWWRKAAEQGYAEAQYELAECYYRGFGVNRDDTQAAYWYRKAAEQGNAKAQSSLGFCYEMGQGVARNYSKAVEWYSKAAENGEVFAQYCLGGCYQFGKGVSKDINQAVELYRKAARQDYYDAKNALKKLGYTW